MTDYQRIASAINYIEANTKIQPSLDDIAHHVGLSPFHFQRLFKEWAGISPKKILQYLTLEHAKTWLQQSESILNTSYEVGLSSPGRLHDLFVSMESVTPGEYKSMGKDLLIEYGFHETPFGTCLLAATQRGLTNLIFTPEKTEALSVIENMWRQAQIIENSSIGIPYIQQLFYSAAMDQQIPLFVKGTPFQIKVWEALLKIPEGCITTYAHIAAQIHKPKAVRAAGTAIGNNPVAYLIPCHRVLRNSGHIGGYRWGTDRKKAILLKETSQISGV